MLMLHAPHEEGIDFPLLSHSSLRNQQSSQIRRVPLTVGGKGISSVVDKRVELAGVDLSPYSNTQNSRAGELQKNQQSVIE